MQTQYIKDCETLFGRLLDGHMMFADDDNHDAVEFTRNLWNSRYPEEDYELHNSDPCVLQIQGSQRKLTYNLEAAIARQSSFYYQVRLG